MLIKKFIASADNHTVEIPQEFYGKEIMILLDESKEIPPALSTNNLIEKYRSLPRIDLKEFKFDRNEANNYG